MLRVRMRRVRMRAMTSFVDDDYSPTLSFFVFATLASVAFFTSALAVFTSRPDNMEGEGWLAKEVEQAVDRRAECIGDG